MLEFKPCETMDILVLFLLCSSSNGSASFFMFIRNVNMTGVSSSLGGVSDWITDYGRNRGLLEGTGMKLDGSFFC